jgi:branched-chain amino acid transport system permease protein
VISYIVSVLTVGAIFTIFSLALNVRWGWAGDLDLSIFGFVAIGAYTSAVFTVGPPHLPPPDHYILGLHLPFIVGALAAMGVCGVLAVVVGSVALRSLRGDYFAITTLATSLILYAVISQDTPLLDGYQGVFNIPQPFEKTLHLSPQTYDDFFFGMCLLIIAALYVVLQMLFKSPFGRALRAAREDEHAAAAFGRNVFLLKLKAFVIGGMMAGLGGALFAHYLSVWNPYAWQTSESFLLLGAILIGGIGNIRGVIVGNFFIVVAIQEVTRYLPTIPGHPDSNDALRFILVGLLIIAVLWWRPQGLIREPRDRDTAPATLRRVKGIELPNA